MRKFTEYGNNYELCNIYVGIYVELYMYMLYIICVYVSHDIEHFFIHSNKHNLFFSNMYCPAQSNI